MITITQNAKTYLANMLEQHDKPYVYLSVEGGGCSGFQYKWDFTEDTSLGTVHEDVLILDAMAEMFVIGCEVDYVNELGGSYLKVNNPNATASCGCGESFAA
jgi:iron-sulfur cluster assembly accessory protein